MPLSDEQEHSVRRMIHTILHMDARDSQVGFSFHDPKIGGQGY